MASQLYDWTQIQKDYDDGLSYRDLHHKYGMGNGTLVRAAKIGLLKARSYGDAIRLSYSNRRAHNKIDIWSELQKEYDAGTWTVREFAKLKGIAPSSIFNARKAGLFKTRSRMETMILRDFNKGKNKLTEEHKARISNGRREFLKRNPHMVPYRLNHYSKGPSYPETYFREVLERAALKFEAEHRIGVYSLDFAFIDQKIDLEIHGSQHYLDPRIVKSDARRRRYLEKRGWSVIEIDWSAYQKLKRSEKEIFVSDLIARLVP